MVHPHEIGGDWLYKPKVQSGNSDKESPILDRLSAHLYFLEEKAAPCFSGKGMVYPLLNICACLVLTSNTARPSIASFSVLCRTYRVRRERQRETQEFEPFLLRAAEHPARAGQRSGIICRSSCDLSP